ncbi:hypothetical protein [Nannocystis pusilla]|uniref:Lipoprotein n=1 Tax=Nannocystis pusilla TaxID=889268 RepID=A0ABS7TXT7_9BACT|nr:hypothetical protein [Nannocystis pusilla]MBZ5712960.1 hypothetical protein [Nannocystis pusilla]
MRPLSSVLALAAVLACAPEATSPCYAPASYSYRGEVRSVGQLPGVAYRVLALPGGRALAITADLDQSPYRFEAFTIDPAGGAVESAAAWQSDLGEVIRLDDGRIMFFEDFACRYFLIDLDEPATVTPRTCDFEDMRVTLLWQASGAEVLLFGEYFGGGSGGGAVFSLDLATDKVTRLATQPTEHAFGTPPREPFPLCDGRLVFPHTMLDGGDFIDDAPAVHYYDPAEKELTSLDLSFAPERAAQLDAKTALLLGHDDDRALLAQLLDLEAGTLRPLTAPDEELDTMFDDTVVGLADGTALVTGEDGAILVFSPETERFAPQSARFAGAARHLLRLSTGPVLAFTDADNQIDIYE